jgi:hypothetical protein
MQPVATALVAKLEKFRLFAQTRNHLIHLELPDKDLQSGFGDHDPIPPSTSLTDRVGRDHVAVKPK